MVSNDGQKGSRARLRQFLLEPLLLFLLPLCAHYRAPRPQITPFASGEIGIEADEPEEWTSLRDLHCVPVVGHDPPQAPGGIRKVGFNLVTLGALIVVIAQNCICGPWEG